MILKLLLIVSFTLTFSLDINAQEIKQGATPPLIKGSSNAPITLEVFVDYQCPRCAVFNEDLKKLKSEFPGDIQIIFRNMPLTIVHQNAMLAAQSVEAANLQNRFYEMMQLLLNKQQKWNDAENAEQIFITYAGQLGLNVEQFKSDMKSQQVSERIALDIERAESLKLNGTPTVFLNNNQINPAEMSYVSLRNAINLILKSKSNQ